MGRSPSSDENGLKKGPWTPEEDEKLVKYIQKHGHGSWRALPKLAGLNRCGKSCRLRWTNYLRPDIRRGKFSQEEEQTILHLHSILGNKWSAIASNLPGRTDNEIKNFWNTHLKKRLIQMGYDPMTHQPRTDLFATLPQIIALANLKDLFGRHLWDDQAARMQAEAARIARLQYQLQYLLQSPSSAVTSAPSNSFEPTSAVGNNLLVNYSVSDSPAGQGSVVDYDSLCFSQLPQLLQVPACGDTPSTATAAFKSSADPSPPSLTDSLIIGGRGNNLGDASSSSTSYGGEATPSWSDIFSTLEDPNLFHEIIP